MPPDTATIQTDAARAVTEALALIVERHGRRIYDDPTRCEAMLRDLCPAHKREIFLIVAALRERVVADLVLFGGALPDDVLVARNSRKLQEGLGLSEVSARWAVEAWLPPAQVIATLPPEPIALPATPVETLTESLPDDLPELRPIDWPWLGLCGGAALCAAVAGIAIVWFSFYHGWASVLDWVMETAIFSAALGAAALGLERIAGRLRAMPAPQHQALDPTRMAAALLVEVVVLLLLPLVAAAGVIVWPGEWIAGLHVAGRNHDLAFHLGRMLQTLPLVWFYWRWVRSMVAVQGAIAASLVRCR